MTTAETRLWTPPAMGAGVVMALGVVYCILGSPLQVSENLRNMLAVQQATFWELFVGGLTSSGFLRPLLLAQMDVVFERSGGRYFEAFKALQAAQVVAAALLLVHLLRVRSWSSLLAALFALTVLFGGHTFAGTVTEAFPLNTFLAIVVCCLTAAALVDGRSSWWRDAGAVAVLAYAVLTVESGLLVWVVFATAWLVGFRGVSRGAVLACTALVAGYLAARFVFLGVGAPGLEERSSGFGFEVLDPPDLIARFGDTPIAFYLYNVVTQVMSVLFAEPKAGVFVLTRGIVGEGMVPRDAIAVFSSTAATALIAAFAVSRGRAWRRGGLDDAARWLLVAGAVLAANAVISYPYTKTVIMSPSGALYALAAGLAFAWALELLPRQPGARAALLSLTLVLLSFGWTVRFVGIHYRLREKAFITRNDWPFVVIGQGAADDVSTYPEAGAMIEQLRRDAISRRVANPAFNPPNADRYFEEAW
jgi:hypothetical protein